MPQESREAFDMLCEAGIIGAVLRDRLKVMVGFRNVAMHDYRKLNLEVIRNIIERHLDDFMDFGKQVLKSADKYSKLENSEL